MKTEREPVTMLERRFNIFPAKFSWRGRVYDVDAVNEVKTSTSCWHRHGTHHYWVKCDGQLFHLCEVLPKRKWLMYSE